MLVALLALASPLALLASKLLTAHMAEHLLLGDIAPLLLVIGLRRPLAFFVATPGVLRALNRLRLRRLLERVSQPGTVFAIWAVTLYAWHLPRLYDAAEASPPLHTLEHACFFTAGVLVWTVILDATRSAGRRAALAALVLLAGMPLTELLIAAAPLYPHYAATGDRPFGLTAAQDQARAGLLMMAEQIATVGTAAMLLLWRHVEGIDASPLTDTGEPR